MTRAAGIASLNGSSSAGSATESGTSTTSTDVIRQEGVDSLSPKTDRQKQARLLEQQMTLVLTGLPDNGRIRQDPETKLLHYFSDGYTTNDQAKIKKIVDSATLGEAKPQWEQYTQEGKEYGLEEVYPARVDEHYGLTDKFGKVGTQMADVGTEVGLLGQQLVHGIGAVGTYADENTADNKTYEQMRQDYAEMNPKKSIAANITGLGASLYGGYGLATGASNKFKKIGDMVNTAKNWYANLAPLAQKAVQVGGTSLLAGTEGAIYGAGEGNTSDERTINAVYQGGMNAAITASIAVVFPIVGSMLNRFKPDKQKIEHIAEEFGIGIEAARLLKEAYESGMSLSDMIKQVERSGDSQLMIDSSVVFERLTDAAKTSSAGAVHKVDSAITGRVENQSASLIEDLNKTLGNQPKGTSTILEDVAKSTKTARSEAYDKAFNVPVNYNTPQGQQILLTLQQIPKKLLDNINRTFIIEGKKTRIKYDGVDSQGNVIFTELPDARTLNELKIALQDKAKSGKDAISNVIKGGEEKLAEAAWRSIRDNLKAINPYYGIALRKGQTKIQTEEAIFLGQKVLKPKTTLDEVKRFMRNASEEELAGAKKGIREHIEEIMSNAKTAAGQATEREVKEAMKLVTEMSSRSAQNKMRLILGEKTANAMFKRLDEVKKALEVQTGVRIGSPTAPRQEIIKHVNDIISGGAVKQFFSGNLKTSLGKLRDFLTGTGEEYYSKGREQIFDELITVLTSSEVAGKTVKQALEYLNKVSMGETLTKPQANFVVKNLKEALESYGVSLGTSTEAGRIILEDKE